MGRRMEKTTVVEIRTYRFRPGAVAEFIKLFREKGLAPQRRILGHFLGMYRTEFGDVNEVVFMWGFASADDRLARREQLYKDPEFLAYIAQVRDLLVSQNTRLMVPASFNPEIDGFKPKM